MLPAAPPAAAPAAAAPRPTPRVAPAPSRAPAATEAGAGSDNTVTVRPGDTAGRIANAHRPASVSLDQMLVAMAQANPKAFVDGNVNRLRSGAVLQMPSESAAQATPASEARQIVAAQSRDFNEFRRRLAGAAPTAQVAAAESELLYQNCEAEGDALVLTSRRTAHYGHKPSLATQSG